MEHQIAERMFDYFIWMAFDLLVINLLLVYFSCHDCCTRFTVFRTIIPSPMHFICTNKLNHTKEKMSSTKISFAVCLANFVQIIFVHDGEKEPFSIFIEFFRIFWLFCVFVWPCHCVCWIRASSLSCASHSLYILTIPIAILSEHGEEVAPRHWQKLPIGEQAQECANVCVCFSATGEIHLVLIRCMGMQIYPMHTTVMSGERACSKTTLQRIGMGWCFHECFRGRSKNRCELRP